jgi:hypothetical protein
MQKEKKLIPVLLTGEEVIYKFDENLKAYHKIRLKGKGTRNNQYLIHIPRLYVENKYCPDSKYSVSFGLNKTNNHQLIILDLDDCKGI